MKPLKCFVGLDNRFVMCEKFPDDEEHAGLDDLLNEFIDADIYLSDKPLEQGFYNIEFGFDQVAVGAFRDSVEEYLVAKKISKINGMEMLKTQTALVGHIIVGEDNEKK